MNSFALQGNELACRRVLLYWGRGRYPQDVYRRLQGVKNLKIDVITDDLNLPKQAGVSAFSIATLTDYCGALGPASGAEILFAGGFSVGELGWSTIRTARRLLLDSKSRQALYTTGFFDIRSKRWLSGAGFLSAVDMLTHDYGVKIASPHDFLSDYKVEPGNAAGNSPILAEEPLRIAQRWLGKSVAFGVAQSLVLAGEDVVARERWGTKRMLKKYARRTRNGASRNRGLIALLKLPAEGFCQALDLPFIGPDTIRQCSEAGIRGVYFCSDYTVVFDKEKTISVAEDARIFLHAFSKETYHAAIDGAALEP